MTILPSLSLVDMIESAKVADQVEEKVFFELSPPARPRLAVLGLDLTPDIVPGSNLAGIVTPPLSAEALFSASGSSASGQGPVLPKDPASTLAGQDEEKSEDPGPGRADPEDAGQVRQADEQAKDKVAAQADGAGGDAARPDFSSLFLSGWQREMLAAADVVCAPKFVLDALADDLPRAACLALAGNGDYLEDQNDLAGMAERLVRLRAAGRRVLALVSGDPLLHGLGSQLASRLGNDELDIRPAPGLAQKMAAALSLPWQDVIPIWLGEPAALARIDGEVWSGKAICLLGSGQQAAISFDQVIHHLLDRGVDWFAVHLLEEGEKIRCLKMEEAGNAGLAPDVILLLIPNAPARCPGQGLDARQLADHHGKYSSLAVRSCAIALMGIEPGHLVWIVGAGNGAMALEAASLAHRGRVVAVEANPLMALAMEENRRRFGAANLDIIAQQAPECLVSLPRPDRVFVAGGLFGGESAPAILAAICDGLTPGGRLVAGFDLLQSLGLCRSSLENAGWQTELCQLQIACSTRVDPVSPPAAWERPGQVTDASPADLRGSDFRLVAENPFFLLAAQKPL